MERLDAVHVLRELTERERRRAADLRRLAVAKRVDQERDHLAGPLARALRAPLGDDAQTRDRGVAPPRVRVANRARGEREHLGQDVLRGDVQREQIHEPRGHRLDVHLALPRLADVVERVAREVLVAGLPAQRTQRPKQRPHELRPKERLGFVPG